MLGIVFACCSSQGLVKVSGVSWTPWAITPASHICLVKGPSCQLDVSCFYTGNFACIWNLGKLVATGVNTSTLECWWHLRDQKLWVFVWKKVTEEYGSPVLLTCINSQPGGRHESSIHTYSRLTSQGPPDSHWLLPSSQMLKDVRAVLFTSLLPLPKSSQDLQWCITSSWKYRNF